MAKQANVISHWCQLIENFQTSSMEFYRSLEKAIQKRSVPETHSAQIEHKEGSLASANRVYFRIHRGKYAFDICAAPFGTGFFISWWFTEPPLAFAALYTLAFLFGVGTVMTFLFLLGAGIGTAIQGTVFGLFVGMSFSWVGVPMLLWLLGNGIRHGSIPGESTVLAMPLVGRVYEIIFAPITFYSVDTGLMFQQAIHNAVLEVIDCATMEKSVRALTETERKPVLKSFGASA